MMFMDILFLSTSFKDIELSKEMKNMTLENPFIEKIFSI
jgi:hypothetical protein